MPSVAAKFRRIALIGKLRSPEVEASLGEIRKFLSSRGCEVLKDGGGADLAIVVGGDGTMLAAARELVPAGVPLVGINQGRVGFMTDIGYDDMRAGIGAILEGRYVVEERSLIDAEILREGKSMLRTVALNEAVVGKGSQGRLIEFELSLDGEFVYALRADGIIVATPTGSTAYSLSAGGPILHPDLDAIVLTPICAHSLNARAVVLSAGEAITIRVEPTGAPSVLTVDGQEGEPLQPDDIVRVARAACRTRLVRLGRTGFYRLLRTKLSWGGER